jgi:hypothetical protein
MNKELRDKMIDYMGKRLVQVYVKNYLNGVYEYSCCISIQTSWIRNPLAKIIKYEDFVMALKVSGAYKSDYFLYVLSEDN